MTSRTEVAFAAHTRQIAGHAIRDFPKKLPEDAVTLAHGHGSIPKLVRAGQRPLDICSPLTPPTRRAPRAPLLPSAQIGQIQSVNVEVTQQALMSLCLMLSSSENKMVAIGAGLCPVLTKLLGDADPTVRQRAVVLFGLLAVHPKGQAAIRDCGAIQELVNLYDDEEWDVRQGAYLAIYHLSNGRDGAAAIIERDILAILVRNGRDEEADLQEIALDTLYNLVRTEDGLADAFNYPTIDVIREVLEVSDAEGVQERAARILTTLCFPYEAKETAIECGCIPTLAVCLKSPNGNVREACASALMAITIDDVAKTVAHSCNVTDALVDLLDDEFETVQLASVKAISNLAHLPKARAHLVARGTEALLEPLTASDNVLIARNSKQALQLVQMEM